MGNARLVSELEQRNRDLAQALERQTATADILRIVAGSPADRERVFDALAGAANRLCDAISAYVWQRDGDTMLLLGTAGHPDALFERGQRMPLSAGVYSGRAVLAGRAVQGESAERAAALGFGRVLAVPMLRESEAIGAIAVVKRGGSGQYFTDQDQQLVQAFADQAVIAIENARLFDELEQRNTELAESLKQQTAVAEVLQTISQSQPSTSGGARRARPECRAVAGRAGRGHLSPARRRRIPSCPVRVGPVGSYQPRRAGHLRRLGATRDPQRECAGSR